MLNLFKLFMLRNLHSLTDVLLDIDATSITREERIHIRAVVEGVVTIQFGHLLDDGQMMLVAHAAVAAGLGDFEIKESSYSGEVTFPLAQRYYRISGAGEAFKVEEVTKDEYVAHCRTRREAGLPHIP